MATAVVVQYGGKIPKLTASIQRSAHYYSVLAVLIE